MMSQFRRRHETPPHLAALTRVYRTAANEFQLCVDATGDKKNPKCAQRYRDALTLCPQDTVSALMCQACSPNCWLHSAKHPIVLCALGWFLQLETWQDCIDEGKSDRWSTLGDFVVMCSIDASTA